MSESPRPEEGVPRPRPHCSLLAKAVLFGPPSPAQPSPALPSPPLPCPALPSGLPTPPGCHGTEWEQAPHPPGGTCKSQIPFLLICGVRTG